MSGHDDTKAKGGIIRFLIDNSILLILGAVIALVWANAAAKNGSTSYQDFIHFDVRTLWGGGDDHHSDPPPMMADQDDSKSMADQNADDGDEAAETQGEDADADPDSDDKDADHDDHKEGDAAKGDSHGDGHGDGGHDGHNWYNLLFIVNDVLMALFFAIAAKEVWESMLPGGSLSNPRKAATPLMATVGGIAGPALVYVGGCYLTGSMGDLGRGWAVPCATDIAFSYLVARMIFGGSHPAIAFLLLLAIADDAAGLAILAVFYPQAPIELQWLGLTVAAMALAFVMKKMKITSHWAYILVPGVMSWFSFYNAHVHAALGLVPIIPFLPHAHTDLGVYAPEEEKRTDTLNEFEHFWKTPVECILGLFGLVNAGVILSSLGNGTWLVLAGLLIGKPLGITLMTLLAEKGFKLEKPAGMDYRHVVTLGAVAGIGFTVALFVSSAAFPVPGAIQDSVKMGALLSFGAAPLSIILAKVLRIKPDKD